MIVSLGPWRWEERLTPGWYPPAGAVAAVDLRPLPLQGQQGGDVGMGVFLSDAPLGGDYVRLADDPDGQVAAKGKAAWRSLTGFQPQGSTVTDLLWDHLTRGSDPDGGTAPCPLMPGKLGSQPWTDLHLGARLRSQPFAWGLGDHAGRVRDVLRKQFRNLHGDAVAGKLKDSEHHRRVLDFWCEEYGVEDWREFVPADLRPHVPGRLRHETTYSESFNKADSSTLGPDLTWFETNSYNPADTWEVIGNEASVKAPYDGFLGNWAQPASDLSSANHYAQVNITAIGSGGANVQAGVLVRATLGTGNTHYAYISRVLQIFDTVEIAKAVNGSYTSLGSVSVVAVAPMTIRITANGSSISDAIDGVTKNSVTDTAISSGLRCGMHGYDAAKVDGYVSSDLAATGTLYTQLERSTRGRCRGAYVGTL